MSTRETGGDRTGELRARIAELGRELAALQQADAGADGADSARERLAMLEQVIGGCPVNIYVKNVEGRYVYVNVAVAASGGRTPEQVLGKTDYDLMPFELADLFWKRDLRVIESGTPETVEEEIKYEKIHIHHVTIKFPLRDHSGRIYGSCSITTDITNMRQAEKENQRLREEILRIQDAALRSLSAPLLPIAEGVVLMPLLGQLDTRRAEEVLERLLGGVMTLHASIVILDVTGVAVLDSGVGSSLVRAAKAVKLLGAQVVLTGVQPRVAQAVVELGIELGGLIFQSTLQSGIAYALACRR